MPGAVALFLVLPAIVMTACYPMLLRIVPALASPYAKADVQKRLGAGLTDAFIVATCVLLSQGLDSIPILIAGAAYMLLRDAMRGQSVGKLLFGLVVVNLETG